VRRLDVSAPARTDLRRLELWLIERGADEAGRHLALTLRDELTALKETAPRGRKRLTDEALERMFRFGGSTYVIRYEFDDEVVRRLRIHHGREDRTL